jgi:hypothetical protein
LPDKLDPFLDPVDSRFQAEVASYAQCLHTGEGYLSWGDFFERIPGILAVLARQQNTTRISAFSGFQNLQLNGVHDHSLLAGRPPMRQIKRRCRLLLHPSRLILIGCRAIDRGLSAGSGFRGVALIDFALLLRNDLRDERLSREACGDSQSHERCALLMPHMFYSMHCLLLRNCYGSEEVSGASRQAAGSEGG